MKKTSIFLMSAAVLGTIAMAAPQVPVHAATSANTTTVTSVATPIKVVTAGPNGAMIYSSPTDTEPSGRLLTAGSHWKVFAQATVNGVVWYNLGGSQWTVASDVARGYSYIARMGDSDHYPNEKASKTTVTAGPNGAMIYSTPTDNASTGRLVPAGSRWKTFTSLKNGELWYNLGGKQWVRAREVTQHAYTAVALTGNKGVLKINYVRGYGIAVWNNYTGGATIAGKKLADGTSWKYFGTASYNGHTWYNLGGNQWIDGRYATLSK
jgi:hypothetical protein